MAFGVKGMPTSFLIDRPGTIRFTHMGYSGNVDVSYRQEIDQLLSEHDVMTLTRRRFVVLRPCRRGALAAGGCATVQPWQRGRLADPCMMFDADATPRSRT